MADGENETKHERIIREPFHYICQTPGKEIRSKLIDAFDYWLDIPKDRLESVKKIVQMLHNASLMIDDIEDNSVLRRGIPVTHSVFGVAQTINTANYMYFVAMQQAVSLHAKAVDVFTTQMLELHRGQGKDIYWRDASVCPSEEEYRIMVIQKTGGLFRLAVGLLQLFSENTTNFGPFLDKLGLFFQIRDDYANLMSREYSDNKSFCEDLTEGKFSFPIIHGINTRPEDSQLLSIVRRKTTDLDVKKYCVNLLHKMGSFVYTRQVLLALEKDVLSEIEALGGNSTLQKVVVALSQLYQEEPAPLSPVPSGKS
ncbi:geranylgeranyl pyrophosphate synthase-like [Sycon ciliatum]|uniref:geranylgeranyl pyrophosphate synthase-like n=1 Tax=Sycon ciliatum TaxID=27933 RepID=UPI0020AA1D0A|eukprot:scpid30185/ scgid14835/ Geranylgeranyl pyrophosphate synthase; (2E,6E)-farnesyl diphosphate synthase; Dimethylallyltranstransferase; Farnesyl diphosphate synthase; Farnesyltranstransferase; Geranylgeranyl diphosphate synthase; Geranyltranstransferase